MHIWVWVIGFRRCSTDLIHTSTSDLWGTHLQRCTPQARDPHTYNPFAEKLQSCRSLRIPMFRQWGTQWVRPLLVRMVIYNTWQFNDIFSWSEHLKVRRSPTAPSLALYWCHGVSNDRWKGEFYWILGSIREHHHRMGSSPHALPFSLQSFSYWLDWAQSWSLRVKL